MRMFKKISFCILGGLFMIGLSGCQVPFTDKQVTLPFFEKSPNDVLGLMTEQMFSQLDTYAFDSEIKAIVKSDDIEYKVVNTDAFGLGSMEPVKTGEIRTNSFIENLSGVVDQTDKENLKMEQSIDFEMEFDESMSFKVGFSQKIIGDDIYFNINKVPAMVEMFLPVGLQETWIVVTSSQEMIEDLSPAIGLSVSTSWDKEELKPFFEKIDFVIKNNSLVNIEERLPDEEIDGANCYRYSVTLNRETLNKLKDIFGEYVSETGFEKNEEDREAAKKLFDDWEKTLVADSGEVWIDKKDFYLRKYELDLKLDLTKLTDNLKEDVSSENLGILKELSFDLLEVDLTITGRFFDFNKKVVIQEPENAKTIMDIIQESLPIGMFDVPEENPSVLSFDMIGTSTDFGQLDIPDTDGDGLDDFAESIYGTDPNNPDTDGDGYTDGSEIENGYNPNGEGTLDDYYRSQIGENDPMFEL